MFFALRGERRLIRLAPSERIDEDAPSSTPSAQEALGPSFNAHAPDDVTGSIAGVWPKALKVLRADFVQVPDSVSAKVSVGIRAHRTGHNVNTGQLSPMGLKGGELISFDVTKELDLVHAAMLRHSGHTALKVASFLVIKTHELNEPAKVFGGE